MSFAIKRTEIRISPARSGTDQMILIVQYLDDKSVTRLQEFLIISDFEKEKKNNSNLLILEIKKLSSKMYFCLWQRISTD